MAFGRYFEELAVGERIRHWPGRTITEADNTWFALLSGAAPQGGVSSA